MEYSTTCPECGYDLRGISSAVCPECGNDDLSPRITRSTDGFGFVTGAIVDACHACRAPLNPGEGQCETCGAIRRAWLDVSDKETMHRLRALLDHHGLLLETSALGQSLAGLADVYGFKAPGMSRLWVEAARFEDIEALLETHGMSIASPGEPIVDRAEPVCPSCQADLDPQAEPICPSCGAAFQWVEIESESDETDASPIGTNDEERGRGLFVDILVALLAVALLFAIDAGLTVAAIVLGALLLLLMTFRLPAWVRFLRRFGLDEPSPDA